MIHISITTFGSEGPYAKWEGSELIASAVSGILRLTGDPDRAPVREALNACTFHADMVAAAKKLIETSDVVLENFRPGVITRLGLGYDVCKKLNPGIVYCSVSGYGQTGPMRDWPAIDNIVQATSGMMSLSGETDGEWMRVGFPVVDTITGQLAAFAILAALFRRQTTGEGDFIDVAMLDASLAFMTAAVVPYLVTGKTMPRTGNTGYSGQPTTGLFKGADGRQVSLGVVQQGQFEALARHLEREDWLHDPRYATSDLRLANAEALKAELSEVIKTRNAEDWESGMSAKGDLHRKYRFPAADSAVFLIKWQLDGERHHSSLRGINMVQFKINS